MHSSDPNAVYIISVAARLVGMHANTLRKYERQGLITPSRSDGNVRLFSRQDLRRLVQIKRLVEDHRVNLAGVEVALALTDRILTLRETLTSGQTMSASDVCRAIDAMLDTLSASPMENGQVGHPQEDVDERRETYSRRNERLTRDGELGSIRRRNVRPSRRGPTTEGTGRDPSEVPDLS